MENKDSVQSLISEAQGRRSLRQFAEVIGINVSSLSRIKSGQLRPKQEIIEKIVLHAENQSLSVEKFNKAFDELFEPQNRRKSVRNEINQNKRGLKAIITMALLLNGHSILQAHERTDEDNDESKVDLELVTNALDPSKPSRWAFDFIGFTNPIQPNNSAGWGAIITHINFLAASYYLVGVSFDRYTVVTISEKAFQEAKSYISHYCTNDEISIMLVDYFHKTVVEEYVIPCKDGRTSVLPFNNNSTKLEEN